MIHSILLDLLLDLSQQYSWECHYSRVGIYLYYNNNNMAANVKQQLAQLANLSHSKDVIDRLVFIFVENVVRNICPCTDFVE